MFFLNIFFHLNLLLKQFGLMRSQKLVESSAVEKRQITRQKRKRFRSTVGQNSHLRFNKKYLAE